MNTLFSLFIMFIACSMGLMVVAIVMMIMGLAGAPGAALFTMGKKAQNAFLCSVGFVITALGQSYIVGAYSVLVVCLLRWFVTGRPELPTWPLWIAAFFHSGAVPTYAMKERPEIPTAQHYTLGIVSTAAFVVFILITFKPAMLKHIYGWVPFYRAAVYANDVPTTNRSGRESIEIAEKKSQSIESFFRNMKYMQSMQLIAKDDPMKDPLEKFEGMRKLVDKMIDEDEAVTESLLNSIYAGWGTEYKGNFMKGVRKIQSGLEEHSDGDFGIADGYFAAWDTWWYDNHKKVFSELQRRFGFETTTRKDEISWD